MSKKTKLERLGRLLVAKHAWRWAIGMKITRSFEDEDTWVCMGPVNDDPRDGHWWLADDGTVYSDYYDIECPEGLALAVNADGFPDLRDRDTLGRLIGLLRELMPPGYNFSAEPDYLYWNGELGKKPKRVPWYIAGQHGKTFGEALGKAYLYYVN